MNRRWRWWHVYVALLVVSFVWQRVTFNNDPAVTGGATSTRMLAFEGRQRVKTDDVQIAFADMGAADGEVVILLHGSPGSRSNFLAREHDEKRLTEMLAEHFRVIAVDLPGFGESTKRIPDYSVKAHAAYMIDLMDDLDIDAAHVLGFSQGSGVALQMFDQSPDRIKSLIFYGGIGIQEGEGSGDYHFEHFKYAVGYAFVAVGLELVPHFGLLGHFEDRAAFLRNFWDTDQRPLRRIIENVDATGMPLLILHGRHDPLVYDWVAEAHHNLVRHSELVMFDASHFMVFSESGSRRLADEIIPFVQRLAAPDATAVRRTVDHAPRGDETPLPIDLDIQRGTNPWLAMSLLIAGTFVSEDLTCITAGLMIHARNLDFAVGLLGCFLGIFIGDVLLWLAGRLIGRPLLNWPYIAKHLPTAKLDRLGQWYETHGWWAVFASRFMPGTRLPLYTTAGMLGAKARKFILWAAVSDFLWTPLLVLTVAAFGHVVAEPLQDVLGEGWLALLATIAVLFLAVRVVIMLLSRVGRARLIAGVSKLWRWEFWPLWIFNAPTLLWYGWLAIRHRSLTLMTAANPCMPDGGWVGESKSQIMAMLPDAFAATTVLIDAGDLDARLQQLRDAMTRHDLAFPVILKPDAGQRGAGVRRIDNEDDARAYFNEHTQPIVVQRYHAGPLEAGVFYVRHPDEPDGRIFSITDKRFPVIEGDGRSTLEMLIYQHPRFRMQASVFLKRHADDLGLVLAKGETMTLARGGNHCQGTLFLDGEHLITPQLEQAIDGIAKHVDGFYFGRFDIRYTDADALKAGRNFVVIELNGVTSESTNIYDPRRSLLAAYRTLFEQWSLAFAIGAANRRRGVQPTPPRQLIRRMWRFYRQRDSDLTSD